MNIYVYDLLKSRQEKKSELFIIYSMKDLIVLIIFYNQIVFYAPLSHKTSVREP